MEYSRYTIAAAAVALPAYRSALSLRKTHRAGLAKPHSPVAGQRLSTSLSARSTSKEGFRTAG